MDSEMEMLGKRVIAKTGPGEYYDEGEAVAYTSYPTYTIKRDDGSRFTWIAHLCEEKQEEETESEGRMKKYKVVTEDGQDHKITAEGFFVDTDGVYFWENVDGAKSRGATEKTAFFPMGKVVAVGRVSKKQESIYIP